MKKGENTSTWVETPQWEFMKNIVNSIHASYP
jgi:hypothetical protein